MDWTEDPYEKEMAGRIYPLTTMAEIKFNDGTKATLAWDPKTFSLCLDVPDRKVTYHRDLKTLVEEVE